MPGSASTTDPSSYLWHADYLTQFASRYGSSSGNTILSSSHLKLASNQVDNYHHDVIKYIENWNEPDRWWNLTNCPNWHFDAGEYAAMTMADWNGDGGTMSGYKYVPDPNNPGQFIQQNYPSNSLGLSGKGLTFVSAGISEFDIPYMQDIVSEFGGNPPFGVINFHHYSDNLPDDINSPNYNIGQVGICPEEDNLRSNLEDVKAEFSSLGVEIWLTEFGYDSNSDSWRRAPEINGEDGDYDSQEVQGQWVIRSFLEAAASGIDRAFVFTLSDPNSDGVGGDEGSGLLKDKSYNYQRKKAWYYVNTMRKVLTDLYYDSDLSEDPLNFCEDCEDNSDCEDLKPRVYKFTGSGTTVYAVWSPSACANKLENVKIPVPTSTTIATRVKLKAGDPDGVRDVLTSFVTEGGVYKLEVGDVTERPIFIILNASQTESPIPCPAIVAVEPFSCDAVRLTWNNGSTVYDAFRLYYVEKQSGTPPSFDITTARFYQELENMTGNTWTSAVVANLEAGTEYWFYVVGVQYGDYGEVVSDATCYEDGKTLNCEDFCWTWIRGNWLSHHYWPTMQAFDHIYTSDFCPWTCDNMKSPGGNNWTWNYTNSAANEITITFPDNWAIDIIYLYDVNDIGLFKIEYQDAANFPNGNWTTVDNYLTVKYLEWTLFTNFAPHSTNIRRLRFTMLDPMANIGEILVCGDDVPGFTGGGGDDRVRYPRIDSVNIISQTTTDVTIQWQGMPIDSSGTSFFKDYLVRYSAQKDTNGYLINPDFKTVQTNGRDSIIQTTIPKISSRTPEFHVGFRPCEEDCEGSLPSVDALIGFNGSEPFTTSFEEAEQLKTAFNPSDGYLDFYLPEDVFDSEMILLDVTGKIVVKMNANFDNYQTRIDMRSLPKGVYFIATKGGKYPVVKKVVNF